MTDGVTIPAIFAGLADAIGDRDCIVHGDVVHTFGSFWERALCVADVLGGLGLGVRRERSTLQNWESGQDHVALMLRNGVEYLESMVGALAARAATFNVNYRYTAAELVSLFADAAPAAVVVHDEFATTVRQALDEVGSAAPVLQVGDDTLAPLVRDAFRYHQVVGAACPDPPRTDWSGDDLYLLFTGGTTGQPKGVLWRQADALIACFSVAQRDGTPFATVEEAVDAASRPPKRAVLTAPPFIHGAAQWMAMGALLTGNRVVIQRSVRTFDARELLETVARDGVTEVMLVGDAFGRPMVEAGPADVPTLRAFVNGGAALSLGVRERLLGTFPGVRVVDNIGSSESGRQATRQFRDRSDGREFTPLSGNVVLSDDRTRVLRPGEAEIGWLANGGRVPLGYLGDPAKTRSTFPVVGDERYAVPGDRAKLAPDGEIQVLGRDATVINTGGEKVFSEEVEAALLSHPAVGDVIVLGRSSPEWGQEVVALVAPVATVSEDQLVAHAGATLARYKLPKRVVLVESVPRTPAGKPDHRGAHRLLDELGADVES